MECSIRRRRKVTGRDKWLHKSKIGRKDVPSGIGVDIVLLGSAVLTVVLVGTLTLVDDADAAAVLPDAAAVALDEESTGIVGLGVEGGEGLAQRRTGVFLVAAETAGDLLVLVGGLFVGVLSLDERVGLDGWVGALAAAGRLVHLLAGEGVRGGGLVGIGGGGSRVAVLAGGGEGGGGGGGGWWRTGSS